MKLMPLFLVLCLTQNGLTHPSLFFTEEELNSVFQKSLHLTGILFMDDSHWTLWMNGKPITPKNIKFVDPFRILKVTADGVTIGWGMPLQIKTMKLRQRIFCKSPTNRYDKERVRED
jgi:hypothetical protein